MELNYTGSSLSDKDGYKYQDLGGGIISFGDVARNLLGRQAQYVSRYIDGSIEGYPALGGDLRFTNTGEANYHSIGIHRDDVEEFIARIHTWRAYNSGYVVDPDDEVIILSDRDIETLEKYLFTIPGFHTGL